MIISNGIPRKVNTPFGPATLVAQLVNSDNEVLVHYSRADYEAGKLTIPMSGPGRYLVLSADSVTEIKP